MNSTVALKDSATSRMVKKLKLPEIRGVTRSRVSSPRVVRYDV
jgi:hypothetical protein